MKQLLIQEPSNKYKNKIEKNILNYWLKNTKIKQNKCYPKSITYIRKTKNTVLKENYYGTLVLELRWNIFNEFLRYAIHKFTQEYNKFSKKQVIAYLQGIIAGEANVVIDRKTGHFQVRISATKQEEQKIIYSLLKKLGLNSKIYVSNHCVAITKKKDIYKLRNLKLMIIHPEKYNKFKKLLRAYKT